MIRSRGALEEHLSAGGMLRLEYQNEPEPKKIWTVPQTGETVHGGAARWAQEAGKLKPMSDGLFPGEAQTFEAA